MNRSSSKCKMKLIGKTKMKRCSRIWTNLTIKRNNYFCSIFRMSTRSIQNRSLSPKSTWTKSSNKRTLSSFVTRLESCSNQRTMASPKTKRTKTSRSRAGNSKLKMKNTKPVISSSLSPRSRWCLLISKRLAVVQKPKSSRKPSPSHPGQSHNHLPKHSSLPLHRSRSNRRKRLSVDLTRPLTESSSSFRQAQKTWTLKFFKRFSSSNKTSMQTVLLQK